jgi:Cu(I)/Ag(I) efflux system membrane protein CusA/SilA
MWSTRVGAEVMKPLATPVLGGMVSSLLHVLIVTPVIFFWLRERQLGLQREALPRDPQPNVPRRAVLVGVIAVVLAAGSFTAWRMVRTRGNAADATPAAGQIVQTVRASNVDIVLRSPDAALRLGRNRFTIEFRQPDGGGLLDVGTVSASANMGMPGMAMSSGLQITPSGVPGRYLATAEFGMAGAWQMAIEWHGPAGQGSVTFHGSVQ